MSRSERILEFFKSSGATVNSAAFIEASQNSSFGTPGCINDKPITAYEITEHRIHLGPQCWVLRVVDRRHVEIFKQEPLLSCGSEDAPDDGMPAFDWILREIAKVLPEKWYEYEYKKNGIKLVGEHTLQKKVPA